jgi:hypothetical protein
VHQQVVFQKVVIQLEVLGVVEGQVETLVEMLSTAVVVAQNLVLQ